ncbi:DNA cytosine methyltransferase [Niallia circulans]|uniref:DNA cytosine methyltransferase n=1 Tax=Niallia circulans TaxID=1397 RepID=UPI002040B340|nr:DNA cytosine methyltransferase [Niallia circulans]MCM2982307.1 DNA cytosine methyltransferase [Niallia circulans]
MRTIDLFSGCGGMSLGFQNAGFDIVAAFDHWEKAIEVYKKNFNHPIFERDLNDIENLTDLEKFNPEIIIGGPPCQDFSPAGLRDESLGRSDLTIKFAEIIKSIRPKYFVMENVERILNANAYNLASKIFKDAGYGLSPIVLDASLCGVPQKRKRFFLLGELNGDDSVIEPFITKNLSNKPMTVRDYFGESLGIEHYYRHPRSYARRGIFSIDEPAPTVRGVNRPIPTSYNPHPGDTTHNLEEVRPLTTIERSYLQTFPRDFVFEGTKTNLEQMIGNAVPVKLAEYVATSLQEYIQYRKHGMNDISNPQKVFSEPYQLQFQLQ